MSEFSREGEQRQELRIIPNQDRLNEVVGILLEARENGEFPYNLDAAQLPHDERNMPPSLPRGGVEHANFLWAVCYYMRGGIKSATAVRSLSRIYEERPDIFVPEQAMKTKPNDIYQLLEGNGLHFSAKTIANHWVDNAARMQERWGGDPRKLFEDTQDYDELCWRIQNKRGNGFKGFQEKMVSMIAYYLMDSELVEYFDFPLPVDLHVLRVSAATEIITFENTPSNNDVYSKQTLDTLRAMYHRYSVEHNISQLDVCNAVWSLSSAICGSQPGNIWLEPNRKDGRQGRKTHIVPMPIDYSDPQQFRMYEESCLQCPVEHLCQHNLPSKPYYVRGTAELSPRVHPDPEHMPVLFSLEALTNQVKRRG